MYVLFLHVEFVLFSFSFELKYLTYACKTVFKFPPLLGFFHHGQIKLHTCR